MIVTEWSHIEDTQKIWRWRTIHQNLTATESRPFDLGRRLSITDTVCYIEEAFVTEQSVFQYYRPISLPNLSSFLSRRKLTQKFHLKWQTRTHRKQVKSCRNLVVNLFLRGECFSFLIYMRNTFLWLSVDCETPDIQLEVTSNRGQILVLAYRYHKAQKNIKNSATIKEFNQISKWTQKYKKYSPTSLPVLILENTMSVAYQPMQWQLVKEMLGHMKKKNMETAKKKFHPYWGGPLRSSIGFVV